MVLFNRLIVALLIVLVCGVCAAAGPDEQWEMTTQMQMQGMSMPGDKRLICQPASSAYDPERGKADKNCTMSEVKMVGNKTSWKMRCTGKDAMDGVGEMTRTADTMQGTIRMQADDMEMTMAMNGRRVGTCSAVAEKQKTDKMIADVQAQAETNTRLACKSIVEAYAGSGGVDARVPQEFSAGGMCANEKPALCTQARARAASFAGYPAYAQGKGWVMNSCGIDLDASRKSLCPKALAAKQLGFLKGNCPVEAAAARAQHCQGFGRGYTSDATHPYAALCR